jgi:hypothetical protein
MLPNSITTINKMKQAAKWAFFTGLLILLSIACQAQLTIKGELRSHSPAVITLTHQSDGNSYPLYHLKSKEKMVDNELVNVTKYRFPWSFEKNYSYSLVFEDGTVSKTIIIHGPVPEGIHPVQRLDVIVDLTNMTTADETLVIYWSEKHDEYWQRPLYELDKINDEAFRPLSAN